jgi:hypothetical protein
VERLFTAPDAWRGGYVELALELGPPSDDRMGAALAALWAHPTLDGCYADDDREPWVQPRVAPALAADWEGTGNRLFGVATLPSGRRHVCLSHCIRYEGYEDEGSEDTDSLSLCLPAPPYEWRAEIEDWLRQVGESVFAAVEFRLGLIGLEVELMVTAEQVRADGVPDERWFAYLWPEDGRLGWFPATRGPTISLDAE